MSPCLSPEDIERYRARTIASSEELHVMHRHLIDCSSCRDAVRSDGAVRKDASAAQLFAAEADDSSCPDQELLFRYVEGKADAAETEIVESHSEDCVRCAQTLTFLRGLRAEVEGYDWSSAVAAPGVVKKEPWRTRLRRWLSGPQRMVPLALGGAALACLLTFWLIARPLQMQVAGLHREAERLQAENRALQQRGQVPTSSNDWLSLLPREVREAAQAAAGGRLTLPKEIAMLNSTVGTVRGRPGTATSLALLAPVGTAVLADRPTFSWKGVAGARRYRITLTDADSGTSQTGTPAEPWTTVAGTTWSPARALARGHTYDWEVSPENDEQQIAQARFRVLNTAEAEKILHARRTYADSPLVLGVLDANAGLLDEAEAQFRKLRAQQPDSPAAQRLLEVIRQAQGTRHGAPNPD